MVESLGIAPHTPAINPSSRRSSGNCGEALFTVGVWHAIRVTADGPKIVVWLDGKQVLQFADDPYASGQICLQGEADGVLYRNVKVTETK